ncbi:MAG: hypothetical protein AB1631_16955 [Acidobacteriota bacterium]
MRGFKSIDRAMIFKPGAMVALAMIAIIALSQIIPPEGVSAQNPSNEITVTSNFAEAVDPRAAIELKLNRALKKEEGKLAVLIGAMDVSSLFKANETTLTYDSTALPLPLGESAVAVYLVSSAGEWKEIARLTLKVSNEKTGRSENNGNTVEKPTEEKPAEQIETKPAEQNVAAEGQTSDSQPQQRRRFGFDKLEFTPALTLSLKSQMAQSSVPAPGPSQRVVFTDLTFTAGARWEMARGSFSAQNQFDFVGVSFRQEAIRFGTLGDEAPRVDLSSYLMQNQIGKAKYLLGHTSYGAFRHLINGFSSRGMTFAVPINNRFDFSLAAMNGTSIVGYDNFFGIARRRHQLTSATLGFEFIPSRPGGLRLEAGMMSGWLQPLNNFSQGAINDAERSRGLGFRLLATDKTQRFRFEGGFTRNQFFNPADALLDQNQRTVDVRPLWRNAHYLDVAYDLLKDREVLKDKKLNLTIQVRHERVDPLFRSLGASTQADKLSNEIAVNASLGEISAQYSHHRFNDNLADIPSILKSLTRGHALSVSVPLASVFGDPQKPSNLLPRVAWNFNRVYQAGAAIPVNGGFEIDPASIPDFVGTNHAVTADWQFEKWRFGYRWNYSLQDNRQRGNETSDLRNFVNGVSVGATLHPNFDLNVELNAESALDRRTAGLNRTLRLAPNFTWRMTQIATLTSNVSFTLAADAADTRSSRNIEFDIQYAVSFNFEKDRFRKFAGQMFIRYANQYSRTRDLLFNDLTRNQTLNVGLSFTLF